MLLNGGVGLKEDEEKGSVCSRAAHVSRVWNSRTAELGQPSSSEVWPVLIVESILNIKYLMIYREIRYRESCHEDFVSEIFALVIAVDNNMFHLKNR